MVLDREAAARAVGQLAAELGMSLEEAAAGIVMINNVRAATAIRQQTLGRALDPRDFVLYAYGGAGPVHAFGFAAEAGIREIVVPLGNGASTFSAYGIACGDAVRYAESECSLTAPFDLSLLRNAVTSTVERARAALAASGIEGNASVQLSALMRYREQLMHSLDIDVPLPLAADASERLLAAFLGEYRRRYGEGATTVFRAIEVFALRARASVSAPLVAAAARVDGEPWRDTTEVYWPVAAKEDRGWRTTQVVSGAALRESDIVTGPALVELAHTTIAVPPGGRVSMGERGDVHVQLQEAAR